MSSRNRTTSQLRVTIVGAGQMGSGVAAYAVAMGRPTTIVGRDLTRALAGTEKTGQLLNQLATNGLIRAKVGVATPQDLVAEGGLACGCAGATLVIEAIPENLLVKQELFGRRDELLPPSVLLASSTSGLRIMEIATRAHRKERIVATHFWFPCHLVPSSRDRDV